MPKKTKTCAGCALSLCASQTKVEFPHQATFKRILLSAQGDHLIILFFDHASCSQS